MPATVSKKEKKTIFLFYFLKPQRKKNLRWKKNFLISLLLKVFLIKRSNNLIEIEQSSFKILNLRQGLWVEESTVFCQCR